MNRGSRIKLERMVKQSFHIPPNLFPIKHLLLDMNRRQFLVMTGGLLTAFSGCSGSGTAPATSTSTQTPSTDTTLDIGETYESPKGRMVTVRDVQIERLIRSTSVGSSTHIDVAWLENHQFAVVEAEATGPNGDSILTDIQFRLEIDDEQYQVENQHWYWAFPPGSNEPPGHPAFPAPISDATSGAIVWFRDADSKVRWKLPSETVDVLGQAPSFTVRSFDAPDSVSRGEAVEASFTVANTGERDGRFITEFGAGPISDHGEVTIDVPAGTEQTHTGLLDPHYSDDTTEIQVTLNWGRERLHRTVTVTD